MASQQRGLSNNANEAKKQSQSKTNQTSSIKDKDSSDNEEEFFSKHYIEPKKPNMNVKFRTVIESVKPPTEVTKILMSTLERDEIDIKSCKTLEEIEEIGKELIEELEELQQKKSKGYDIYQQYEDLQYKFQLAKEVKQKIQQRNEMKMQQSDIKSSRNEELMRLASHKEKMDAQLKSQEKEIARKNYEKQLHADANKNAYPPNEIRVEKHRNADHHIEKKSIPPNELKDKNIGAISSSNLDVAISRYTNEQNSYQILFVFYKCEKITEDDFANYLKEIFKTFEVFELSIALCVADSNMMYYTSFVTRSSFRDIKRNSRIAKNFNEVLTAVPGMNWSDNSRFLKLAMYITPKKGELDEITSELVKGGHIVSSIESKNISQVPYQYKERDFSKKRNSFYSIVKEEYLECNFNKMKMKWLMEELYVLKRLSSVDELNDYKKGNLRNREISIRSGSYNVEFKCLESESYPVKISFKGFKSSIVIKSKSFNITKNLNILEAHSDFDEKSKCIYWLEKFPSNAAIMSILEINATVRYLASEFNKKAKIFKQKNLEVTKNYLLSSTRNFEHVLANRTNLAKINDAKIEECSRKAKEVVDAFTHFTYKFSEKNLLVLDLRTIETKEDILITESVIFSKDTNKFGASNLGSFGINTFFTKHECNYICMGLNLKGFINKGIEFS